MVLSEFRNSDFEFRKRRGYAGLPTHEFHKVTGQAAVGHGKPSRASGDQRGQENRWQANGKRGDEKRGADVQQLNCWCGGRQHA